MPAKPQTSDSSMSVSESESSSSDEEQETAVTQATPQSRKPAPNAKPPVSDDEDEEDEEEEEDEDGSDDSDPPPKPGKPAVKVEAASAVKTPVEDSESESESESSEFTPKPPSPRRPSREADSSAKPVTSMPKDRKMTGKKPSPEKPKMPVTSAVGADKRKRKQVENGEQGEAAANGSCAKKGKMGGQLSSCTGGFAVSKRLIVGGEDVEREAEVLYPSLRDALRLLETEDGNILQKGTMVKAIQLLNPDEANALEGRWKKHLAAGVRYYMERAALKEDLLKSFVGVLDGK